MSASREKKQRQGADVSVQQTKAQEQNAAYKKKVKQYTIIGIVIAVLVVLLLVWNSGLIQRNQTAATVDGTKYSVNDVNYFYQTAKYNANYIYYMYGIDPPADDTVIDETTGETYHDHYLEQALGSLTQLTALYDAAIENGYSDADVAEDIKAQIKETKAGASSYGYAYRAYLKAQFGRYMTPAAYKAILTKSAVADLYYNDYTDTLTFDQAELEAYYEENKDSLDTFKYSYLYFTPAKVEDENLTDAEKSELETANLAQAKILAEKALAAIEGGSTLAEQAEVHTDATFTENTETTGSALSTVFAEKLKELSAGEYALVENGTSGYYVLTLVDRFLSDKTSVDVRHVLVRTEEDTEEGWKAAETKIEEIKAEYLAGEQTEEAFAALANKYSDDTGSNTTGGLYSGVVKDNFVAEFDAWLFDQEHNTGDVDVIKHVAGENDGNKYNGYHLAYFVGEKLVWQNTATSALISEAQTEWVDSLVANYTDAAFTNAVKYVAE